MTEARPLTYEQQAKADMARFKDQKQKWSMGDAATCSCGAELKAGQHMCHPCRKRQRAMNYETPSTRSAE